MSHKDKINTVKTETDQHWAMVMQKKAMGKIFDMRKTIRSVALKMADQQPHWKNAGNYQLAVWAGTLFSMISIALGYGYLQYYTSGMLSYWGALAMAVIGMIVVEVVKNQALNSAFEDVYSTFRVITYQTFLYAAIGLTCIFVSAYSAINGVKVVYDATYYNEQKAAIKAKYEADKAANEAVLQSGMDSVRRVYLSEVKANNDLMNEHRADRSNYINGEFSWNLRNTHSILIEKNSDLKNKANQAAKEYEQQFRNRLDEAAKEHKTEQLSVLNEKAGTEIPLIKIISASVEALIVFCLWYKWKYGHEVQKAIWIEGKDTYGLYQHQTDLEDMAIREGTAIAPYYRGQSIAVPYSTENKTSNVHTDQHDKTGIGFIPNNQQYTGDRKSYQYYRTKWAVATAAIEKEFVIPRLNGDHHDTLENILDRYSHLDKMPSKGTAHTISQVVRDKITSSNRYQSSSYEVEDVQPSSTQSPKQPNTSEPKATQNTTKSNQAEPNQTQDKQSQSTNDQSKQAKKQSVKRSIQLNLFSQ